MLAAQRFGVAEAGRSREELESVDVPDDPEVIEANVDLLLEHGHGRTDAQRALELLEPAVEVSRITLDFRFSLADAQRKLGKFKEAEEVLEEVTRGIRRIWRRKCSWRACMRGTGESRKRCGYWTGR